MGKICVIFTELCMKAERPFCPHENETSFETNNFRIKVENMQMVYCTRYYQQIAHGSLTHYGRCNKMVLAFHGSYF